MEIADARYGSFHVIPQMLLLWDFHALRLLEAWQTGPGRHARRWLGALGELEALAALAGLAHDQPRLGVSRRSPRSPARAPSAASPRLAARALGHPLIADRRRVGNDVEIGPAGSFLLVTGSNMAGKSTLLRALGANVVLAQAGGPVCAEAMTLPPLTLATSILVEDSLAGGVSFFMAELLRIRRVVEAARAAPAAGRVLLYLIDEPLRGTNSRERRIAVERVLGHLLAARSDRRRRHPRPRAGRRAGPRRGRPAGPLPRDAGRRRRRRRRRRPAGDDLRLPAAPRPGHQHERPRAARRWWGSATIPRRPANRGDGARVEVAAEASRRLRVGARRAVRWPRWRPAPRDHPLIFGIETSCDDTACAVVDAAGRVLASVVSSQLAAHRPYGGVVPEIASREHLKNWPPVSAEALRRSGVALARSTPSPPPAAPGWWGRCWWGSPWARPSPTPSTARSTPSTTSKGTSTRRSCRRRRGMAAAPRMDAAAPAPPPPAEPVPDRFTGLVVSGGHTSLFRVADGEVDDPGRDPRRRHRRGVRQGGRRLGLPYPQGPRVDELAEEGERGDPAPAGTRPASAVARCGDDSLDFSYSGLKSQALLAIEALERRGIATDLGGLSDGDGPAPEVLALLAAFRRAAVGQLLDRLERLHRREPLALLAVSGGVAANRLLRREAAAWAAAARGRAAPGAAGLRRRQRGDDRPRRAAPPPPRPGRRPLRRRGGEPHPALTRGPSLRRPVG